MYTLLFTKYRKRSYSVAWGHFRKNIFDLLEQTIRFNEPINVTTKNGNAVVLSEEDYNGLMETLHLSSIPGMKEKIMDGLKTPLSECVPESEVEW